MTRVPIPSELPRPDDAFEWTPAAFGFVLRCRPLMTIAEHFFTVASLTLRDDPAEWEAVAETVGVGTPALRLLHQVHGRTIVRAEGREGLSRPEADGVISDDPALALVVRVADCAPLLMADARLGVVAAVHAGWRSTMQSIAPAAVAALGEQFGSRPDDLVVAIGPSLGQCCGEMGEEVVDAFRVEGHSAVSLTRWFRRQPGGRPHFDLWQANVDQLTACGVRRASIYVSALCTRTYPEAFHSYRARGAQAGRMAAVIRARS